MASITTALDSLRRRPLHERKILAAALYLTAAMAIAALWVTSLGRTLSSFSGEGAAVTSGPELPPAGGPEPERDAGPSPLAALYQAFGAAAAETKRFMSELRRAPEPAYTAPAEPRAGEAPLPAAPAPSAKRTAAMPPAAAAKTGPAKTVAGVSAALPYSAYATARLLSTPLGAPSGAPEAAPERSRIRTVIAYNIGELRRTAEDVYRYFSE